MADEDCVLVYSTCPDAQTARDIGRALVNERFAACVNILPGMTALFRWEGEVREETEVVLIAKSRRAEVDRLIARGCELHPYETPAFVAVPIVAGAEAYLAWVRDETDGGAS